MFCSNCGMKLESNGAFCPNCGKAVIETKKTSNDMATKKHKNKIIGLAVCAVAFAILVIGVMSIIRIMTAENHEEIAVKYAESYYKANYEGIKDCLPYDVDEMFFDMFCISCKDDEMTLEEGYEDFEEEFEININGADDLLPKYCEGYAQVINDENISIDADVLGTYELEDYEISAAIDENNDYYSEWGIDLCDYIEQDKIKEGYKIELIVAYDDGENSDSENITYTVVKYKGKWKVLTIFDPDMY